MTPTATTALHEEGMTQTSSTVFVAPVVTMDSEAPRAEAFAVSGGRIVAVGTVDHVRSVVRGAPVCQLPGVVLPGLIDAHMHMQRGGLKSLDHVEDGDDVEVYIQRMRDSFDDDGPEHPPFEDRIRGLVRVQPLLHSLGITGIVDPAVTTAEMRGYQAARRRGLLTMRTVAMPYLEIGSAATPDVDAVIAHLDGTGVSTGFGDDTLRLGPIKVYSDGEALKGQALLEQPWTADGYTGLQRISDEEFTRLVRWCGEHGWGVGTHAVGGGAVALLARAYAQAGDAVSLHRFQAIHAYLEASDESIRVLAELGTIASLQPSIIWHNGRGLRAALGERAERANPVRTWLDAGATVAFGSDGPFFAFDPRHLMWQAITRRVAGEEERLSATEAITIQEALAAYTTGAARAALAENDRGMIRPGMCADWALWSADPTAVEVDELRALTVRRTDIGGVTVYDRTISSTRPHTRM
ncbi:amidohydrolase [Microbacterium sp. A204]|uniref:amidohydrolase n=1 Tax=Microbacterium sp. A204 TaxID=3457321 RepID=UPI003FCF1461